MDPARDERTLLDLVEADAAARAALVEADEAASQRAADQLVGRRRWTTRLRRVRAEVVGRRGLGMGLPLATLPTVPGASTAPVESARPVGGTWRSSMRLDPPTSVQWSLDLREPVTLHGWLAIVPDVWETRYEPVRLDVRLSDHERRALASTSLTLFPRLRLDHRCWVPWRLALPAAGPSTLELAGVAPLGGMDRAWLAVGDAELVVRRPDVRALTRRWYPARRARGRVPAAELHRHRPTPGAPPVSVLMPVHDPDLELLAAAVESVLGQTVEDWELCIVDDGSRRPEVSAWLRALAGREPRVRLARHDSAQGISAATNAALAMARSTFVATLDHDDLLHPEALQRVLAALAQAPETDVLYTDNDLVVGERRFSAALKPDWSPDALRACMYTLHLGVYRRSLVQEIGGWRSEFDGAQDHDLVLRLSERTDRVTHVPAVLAHWRAHAGSAAMGELAKPYAYERGRRAVEEHVRRLGCDGAAVERLPTAGMYRVHYPRTGRIVVLVPAGLDEELRAAWSAKLRSTDELRMVPAGDHPHLAWSAAVADLADDVAVVVAEDLCRPPESIDELVGYVEAGAAAAGGVVVDQRRRVVAGPLAFPTDRTIPLHVGADLAQPDRHPTLAMTTNRAAVRGVVAVTAGALRRAAGDGDGALGGLASITAAEHRRGGRVVFVPHVECRATPAAVRRLTTIDPAALVEIGLRSRQDPYWNAQRSRWRSDEAYDERDLEPGRPSGG